MEVNRGGGSPSCGGSRPLLAAWGEPSPPRLAPAGGNGKGGFKFLAAAGFWPLAATIPLHMCHLPASRYCHLKAGIPKYIGGLFLILHVGGGDGVAECMPDA